MSDVILTLVVAAAVAVASYPSEPPILSQSDEPFCLAPRWHPAVCLVEPVEC